MEFKMTSKQMTDHVWLMHDGEASCYLVVGEKQAAVIDTANGYCDIMAEVRKYTDLPVIVLNTHGHGDHICGNVYFDNAYLDEADLPLAERFCQNPKFIEECQKHQLKMPPFQFMKAGDIFDLGGLTMTVIACPGHTAGSVLFLLNEERVLFTGDAINRHTWMQLDGCSTLRAYRDVLQGLTWLTDKADTIFHGHTLQAESISLLTEQIQGLNEILESNGAEDPVDYKWFGGVAARHAYGDSYHEMIYLKERIG